MEKFVKRNEIYHGKIISVVCDDVTVDDHPTKREVVQHNGGACIALRDNDGKVFMVRQYRYALEEDMLEFCAGKIEKDEDPDQAILRESEEELGYSVKDLVKFPYMVPTCGYSNEKIYLYYGVVDKKVGQHLDLDERIDVEKYSYDEIEKMIMEGEIIDAKTICLMFDIKAAGLL